MKYENLTVVKKENSEVEISGEIPADVISSYRNKALKNVGETVNIPGFRMGHVPEKVLVDRVGEVLVLEESAELAIKDATPEIIEKNVPNYIGRPNISITKLAPGNPLGFKITIAVMPEVKLPDYKSIAKTEMSKEKEKVEVTDKELVEVIEQVRKQRAHVEYHKAHHDKKDHNYDEKELEKYMPEFNDEFVKTVGNFTDAADFKAKAKENMQKEKEHRALEKRRGLLLEKLVAESDIKLPQILIDGELSRMFAQFEQDIAGIGLKVENYMKHIKKTPEDLRKDWTPDAEKRAKLNLVLDEIAKKENITADKAAVEEEVKHLITHHKDIDKVRAELYVTHNLTIEKVIQWLESQK